MGLLMSEATPADLAMEVLKGKFVEKDKVEKFLPLAIPAAFGAYGAYRGAGGQFFDDDGNWDPGFKDTARYEDPLTGGMLMGEDGLTNPYGIGEIEDANWAQRAGGAALGATQAINPFTWVRGAGKGLQALGNTSRASRIARNAKRTQDAADAAADTTRSADMVYRLTGGGVTRPDAGSYSAIEGARQGARNALQGAGDYSRAGVENAAIAAGGKRPFKVFPSMRREVKPYQYFDYNTGKVAQNMGRRADMSGLARLGHVVGRGAQMYGHGAGDVAAGFLGTVGTNAMSGGNVDVSMGDSGGYAGGAGTTGDATQGYSQGRPQDLIWDPTKAQSTGATWDNQFVNQAEYGQRQQIRASENMNIGEQLLKDAKKDMEKPPKGKKGGMILIIGHGGKPPKGGKSDKDDKKDGPC